MAIKYEDIRNVEMILEITPILSTMVNKAQMRLLLQNLMVVLSDNVEGDIVELGCNCGTTSVFLQSLIENNNLSNSRKLYLYDSFEGLPEKREEDMIPIGIHYKKGSCTVSKEILEHNLAQFCKTKPTITTGWFKDISNDKLPTKIAFAFFDGDFYDSIIDSFEKVYDRLSKGAVVCVHDYGWKPLPGVKIACNDFLKGKPEEGTMIMDNSIGIMRKL